MLYRISSETSIHVCDNRKKFIRKYQKMPICIYEHDGNFALDVNEKIVSIKFCPLCGLSPDMEKYEPSWGLQMHDYKEFYEPTLDH